MIKNEIKTLLRVGNCKCGKPLKPEYMILYPPYLFIDRKEPLKATYVYCPKRKLYNFWQHNKKQLLLFDHLDLYQEEEKQE